MLSSCCHTPWEHWLDISAREKDDTALCWFWTKYNAICTPLWGMKCIDQHKGLMSHQHDFVVPSNLQNTSIILPGSKDLPVSCNVLICLCYSNNSLSKKVHQIQCIHPKLTSRTWHSVCHDVKWARTIHFTMVIPSTSALSSFYRQRIQSLWWGPCNIVPSNICT